MKGEGNSRRRLRGRAWSREEPMGRKRGWLGAGSAGALGDTDSGVGFPLRTCVCRFPQPFALGAGVGPWQASVLCFSCAPSQPELLEPCRAQGAQCRLDAGRRAKGKSTSAGNRGTLESIVLAAPPRPVAAGASVAICEFY